MTRKMLAANLGNVLEWYDYILYGYLAPVFALQFFPAKSHYAAMLAAFATFAAGYITRPLGGIVLAHLGDKTGRAQVIRGTLPIMIAGTFCLGLMPTYRQIGITAPILITVIRLIQGFVTGGQSTGTYVYVAENSGDKQQSRAIAIAWSSLTAGILLGSIICLCVFSLVPKQHHLWAWRIPYLLSIVFAFLWWRLRYTLHDDHIEQTSKLPIATVFTTHSTTLLRAIVFTSFPSITYYILLIFGVTFLSTHGQLSLIASMGITCIGLLIGVVITPLIGQVADSIGRRKLLLFGSLGMLLLTYPIFHLLLLGHFMLSLVGILLLLFFKDCFAAPAISTILQQFPQAVRFSGFSISWNIANGFFGGTAPLISLWLIHHMQNPIAPSFYLIAFSVVAIVTVLL